MHSQGSAAVDWLPLLLRFRRCRRRRDESKTAETRTVQERSQRHIQHLTTGQTAQSIGLLPESHGADLVSFRQDRFQLVFPGSFRWQT